MISTKSLFFSFGLKGNTESKAFLIIEIISFEIVYHSQIFISEVNCCIFFTLEARIIGL